MYFCRYKSDSENDDGVGMYQETSDGRASGTYNEAFGTCINDHTKENQTKYVVNSGASNRSEKQGITGDIYNMSPKVL